MKRTVHYPPIGDVVVCTRRNALRTTFRVSAAEVKIVTSPWLIDTVFPLAEERIQWILAAREQLQSKAETFVLTPDSEVKTCFFTLHFAPMESSQRKTVFVVQRSTDEVKVFYRADLQFETTEVQQSLRRILKQLLKAEAERYLPNRLAQMAEKHGFKFSSSHINSATGRWGSCTSTKRINLSLYLMLLPAELIDFVLVHELCHTKEMNHGEKFKQQMRAIFADYDLLNRRLKDESRRVAALKMR